jgi:hypothetical protein
MGMSQHEHIERFLGPRGLLWHVLLVLGYCITHKSFHVNKPIAKKTSTVRD